MGDPSFDVAISIREELSSLPVLSPLRCIYKVPENIRKVQEELYRPWMVSIGPIYHQHPSLQTMQTQKLRHLKRFIARGNPAYDLDAYVGIIRGWEHDIRGCYAEEVSLSSNDFIKMVLLDAAFIIDLLMWSSFKFSLENHPIDGTVEVLSRVSKDIYLEENQLPFSVLKGLYDIAFGTTYPHISFVDLTLSFMNCGLMPGKDVQHSTKSEMIRQHAPKIGHFVDFLRLCCLPSKLRSKPTDIVNRYPLFPLSVSQLRAVGVKFVASKSTNLLDIKFSRGVLEIPKFNIQYNTESVFKSIMIFEHSHYFLDSYFVDYIFFLDSLIKTPEDVEILVRKGIIENWIGSNEAVANIFNSTKNISLFSANFYYYDVCSELSVFANTSWHRWKAVLSKDYFSHPWAVISVIYALVILVLTLLQTISSLKPK